ncbi:SGNH/GDSL hydrolase family protein [Nocardia carnea]|uniref:SGNH/GDSL hydrolase family protein n=1 Tax=Nocardia carnea TaxID=37328 RepID=UPI002456E471|nr:SGNH/GDSL hydrolase family protein [Nocardia carnea]
MSSRLVDQANLPQVGEAVVVEDLVCRGYVHRLSIALQVRHPHSAFRFFNHAEGGATSRTVRSIVARTADRHFDIAVVEVGINDALRVAQRRDAEAVSLPEFAGNYSTILEHLNERADTLICIGSPPVGWAPDGEDLDVVTLNREIARYNAQAAAVAERVGARFVDVGPGFVRTAELLTCWSPTSPSRVTAHSLWSDGLHPSELGVELIASLAMRVWPEVK